MKEECGKCRCCLTKTKFGGSGSKGACILRKCLNLQPAKANVKANSTTSSGAKKKCKAVVAKRFDDDVYEKMIANNRTKDKGKRIKDDNEMKAVVATNGKKDKGKRVDAKGNSSLSNQELNISEEERNLLKGKLRTSIYGRSLHKFNDGKCAYPSCLFTKRPSSAGALVKCMGYECNRLYHKKCAEQLQRKLKIYFKSRLHLSKILVSCSVEIIGGDTKDHNPTIAINPSARSIPKPTNACASSTCNHSRCERIL